MHRHLAVEYREKQTWQRVAKVTCGSRANRRCRLPPDGVVMSNLFEQAINTDDGDLAAEIIRRALGIETDDVVNYCFPKDWPVDRDQRAPIIGEWLQTEARF